LTFQIIHGLDFSNLPGRRASFSVCALSKHELKDVEFILMTIRSHDQFNITIYGMDDLYRGIYNERRIVPINPKDAEALGLNKLDVIVLLSHYDGIERKARNFLIIPYNIPEDNLAAYFPEANILIHYDQFADKSNTPIKPITIPTNNKLKKGWMLNLEDAITIRITTKINYIKINMDGNLKS